MNFSINCSGCLVDLSEPKVMGILNLTPDSFYKSSRKNIIKDILSHTQKMLEDGADFIDIGGMSTRPGVSEISAEEEKERLIGSFTLLRKEFPNTIFSIDTYRADVAELLIGLGANIINDISGGDFDARMFEVISKNKTPYILMHTTDKPDKMQHKTQYENILAEIVLSLGAKIKNLFLLGAKDIIVDPGFGFGKTLDQNYFMLKNLNYFTEINCPLLVGISRKSMIYKHLNISPEKALTGTIALNMIALQNGATILRVHDVLEAKQTIELFNKLKQI
jgi:dihydropteroate synthase